MEVDQECITPLGSMSSCCVVSDFDIIIDGVYEKGVIGNGLPELQCVSVVSEHDIETPRRGGCG